MNVILILLALCWISLRSLWNLPDGRDVLRRELGLVLMSVAMLSKSLIHLSVDGWGMQYMLCNGIVVKQKT